jgi:hypothetical protein
MIQLALFPSPYCFQTILIWQDSPFKKFLIKSDIDLQGQYHENFCPFCCVYLQEFSKKFDTVLMGYSWAWGKLIYEKT